MFSLNSQLEANLTHFKDILESDNTVKFRTFKSKDSKITCGIIFTDGMSDKIIINENIIRPITNSLNNMSLTGANLFDYIKNSIVLCDYIEKTTDESIIISSIMFGNTALFIDGSKEVLILNTKGGYTRAIDVPPSENVVRGSREGFTENILINITLIKKRIQDTNLKFEYREIGRKTKTRICLSYIKDIAPEEIVNEAKRRLDTIDIDGILESGYIEELIRDEPLSPFKTIGSTERPDVAAGKLLEGRVIIICDGTPFVLTIPYLFVESFQASEDYYNNYIFSSFNRLLRILTFILTTSVPAIYIALVTYHHEMIPTKLFISISMAREGVPFPTVVEATLMLLTFEILREAGVRLPKQIGQAVSIAGALVLGEAAVRARLISAPIVIVVALTGISGFAVPTMLEVVVLLRFIFIIASSLFGIYGYIFAVIGLLIHLMPMKSFGVNYMEYADVIDKDNIKDTAIRSPWRLMEYRPRFIVKNRKRIKTSEGKKD